MPQGSGSATWSLSNILPCGHLSGRGFPPLLCLCLSCHFLGDPSIPFVQVFTWSLILNFPECRCRFGVMAGGGVLKLSQCFHLPRIPTVFFKTTVYLLNLCLTGSCIVGNEVLKLLYTIICIICCQLLSYCCLFLLSVLLEYTLYI